MSFCLSCKNCSCWSTTYCILVHTISEMSNTSIDQKRISEMSSSFIIPFPNFNNAVLSVSPEFFNFISFFFSLFKIFLYISLSYFSLLHKWFTNSVRQWGLKFLHTFLFASSFYNRISSNYTHYYYYLIIIN